MPTKKYPLGKYLSFAFNPCRLENLCRKGILFQHLPGILLWRKKATILWIKQVALLPKASSARPQAKWCGFTLFPKLRSLKTYQPMVLFWLCCLNVGFSVWDVWAYPTCHNIVASDSFLWLSQLPLDISKVIGCHRLIHICGTCVYIHYSYFYLELRTRAMHCQCMCTYVAYMMWRPGSVCMLRHRIFPSLVLGCMHSSSPWPCSWSVHVIYIYLESWSLLHCKNKSSCLLIYQQPRGTRKFSMYTGKVFVFLCT